MTKYSLPRGMRDLDGKEMATRQFVYDKVRQVLNNYNFQIVEPSPIENLGTLIAKSGEAIKNEIYWFKDKADRDLGLRFDLTVGITRMVASKPEWPTPIKIAAVSDMFRYDEPQFGRYRNFYQWDVEIFGSNDSAADAEVIAVGTDILESLNLKNYVVRINNRKLTEGVVRSTGIEEDEVENVLRSIDKIKKVGEEKVRDEFKSYKLDDGQIEKIIDFIKLSGNVEYILGIIKAKLPNNDRAKEGYNELERLSKLLKDYGIIDKCVIDTSVVRGIGYYTGTVFECYDKGKENLGSIFGGGRFDTLAKIYGRDMPATGVAGGIDRLLLSLEGTLELSNIVKGPQVFVANTDDELLGTAIGIVRKLRSHNISTEYNLKSKNLKKQMEYANSIGVSKVIIVGEEELKKNIVKIRDMKTSEQVELPIEGIKDYILSN